ncbi:MAG: hypothetical protein WD226_13470 [Planctomycetota bacterium]
MAARKKKAEPTPPEALAALERELENGAPRRAYVLRGDEPYFHDRAIRALVRRADALGWEVARHDAERGSADFELSRFIDDLSSGGLFASARLVILGRADEVFGRAKGASADNSVEAVKRFVASDPCAGALVLSAKGLRADSKVVKAIVAAGGAVLPFRKLWDTAPPWNPDPRQCELVQWFAGRARDAKLTLTMQQALFVCASTGNDLAALEDRIGQLAGAAPGELEKICGWTAGATPWDVADHLVDGDAKRALAGVAALFEGGFVDKTGRRTVDVPALANMLLAAVLRSVRQRQMLADGLARGWDERRVLAASGVAGPPARTKTALARAGARKPSIWRDFHEDVASLDRRLKSSAGLDRDDFVRLAVTWRIAQR